MKAFTDLEQSEKLTEILPLESADMWYHPYPNDEGWYDIPNIGEADLKLNQLPCWSLAALLSVLSDYTLQTTGRAVFVVCKSKEPMISVSDAYNNPVDACYEMILKLHELKML